MDRARAECPRPGPPRGAERTEWGLNVETRACVGLWMNLGAVHLRSLWAATPSIQRRDRSPSWMEMKWLQDRVFRRPCAAVLMTVPCALADGAGAPSRGSCLLTVQSDPTRSGPKTGPQPIDFGLPGLRFSGHPERRIFPPHGSKRFGMDLSAIKPSAGCLNAAEPESRTVNSNLNRASGGGLASRHSRPTPIRQHPPSPRPGIRDDGWKPISIRIFYIRH